MERIRLRSMVGKFIRNKVDTVISKKRERLLFAFLPEIVIEEKESMIENEKLFDLAS